MNRYFITFGQRWRRDPHPMGGHPDGWFSVKADDMEAAIKKAYEFFGIQWSNIYSEDEMSMELYPKGEIATIL